jgi:iron complex outermembrane receptor protein
MAILLASTCLTLSARAQSAPPSGDEAQPKPRETILDEIVVTDARRREESVQQTPVAVDVLNAQTLQSVQANSISDIASLSPNLEITHQIATPDVASIYLRGFGVSTNDPAIDPAIAVYVDGIYQPTVSGTLLDLFDVSQVEVLKGPQGTLLGKNSPSGAISVSTARPTGNLDGEIQLDYGDYDLYEARGKLDFPIVPGILAAKISVLEEEGGGYIKDIAAAANDLGGVNLKAGRLGLLYTPTPDFTWYVSASDVANRDPQQGLRDISTNKSNTFQPEPYSCLLFGNCYAETTPYRNRQEFTQINHVDTIDVASNASYRFGPVTLTSVTGYKHYWGLSNSDIDGEPEAILEQANAKLVYDQESQELRLGSNANGGWDLDGHLDWVAGGFFSNEHYREDLPLRVFGAIAQDGQIGITQSDALFAHLVYHLTDQWSLSAGDRESWDHKQHDYYIGTGSPFIYDIPLGSHNNSAEFGTQFQITPDKMVYFRFAQGYRAGGFIGTPGSLAAAGSYQPETDNTYEVGVKTDWLDRKLRINADLFRQDYANLQESVTKSLPVAPFLVLTTENAASSTVQGAELEITAVPLPALTLTGNLGYLNAAYDKFFADIVGNGIATNNSGFRFGFAPQLTLDLRAQYVVEYPNVGTATFMTDFNYRTSQQLQDSYAPATQQSAYGLVNASVRLDDESDTYSLTFYGKNILNRHYYADVATTVLAVVATDGAPATWGLTLTAKF